MSDLLEVKKQLKKIEKTSGKGPGLFHKMVGHKKGVAPTAKLLSIFQESLFDNNTAREFQEMVGILGGLTFITKRESKGHPLRQWVADDPKFNTEPLMQEMTQNASYDRADVHFISAEELTEMKKVYRELAELFHEKRVEERAGKKI